MFKYTIFIYIITSIFELGLDVSYFFDTFSLGMFLQMFLNFNNGNLITFKRHLDKIRQ